MKLKTMEYWASADDSKDCSELLYISTLEKLRIFGSHSTLLHIPKTTSHIESLFLDYVSSENIENLIEIINVCPHLKEVKIHAMSDKNESFNWEKVFDNLAQLKKLEKLDLSSCKLKELHKNIGKLTTLKELDLHFNELTDLPNSLESLQLLEMLDVSNNKFGMDQYKYEYMPEPIFKLGKLQVLKCYSYTRNWRTFSNHAWETRLSQNVKVFY
jgi:Leucine-rich repeat (LRR) protein